MDKPLPKITGRLFRVFGLPVVVVCFGLAWGLLAPLISGDIGWLIRVGEWIVTHAAVPREELFCFTAQGHPWVCHEWLSAVLFYLADRVGSFPGLIVLRAASLGATLVLLMHLARRYGTGPVGAACLVGLVLPAVAFHVSLRPWLFSDPLLAILLLLLSPGREPSTRAWGSAPAVGLVVCLWANLHGSWPLAAAIVVIHGAARLRSSSKRREGLALLVSPVLALVTPYGLSGAFLPLRYMLPLPQETGLALTQAVVEWAPADPGSLLFEVMVGLFLLLGAALLVTRGRPWPETLVALAVALLALRSSRHIPILAVVSIPLLARGLAVPLGRFFVPPDRSPWGCPGKFIAVFEPFQRIPRPWSLALLLALASAIAAVADPGIFDLRVKAVTKRYPVDMVDLLRQPENSGRLLPYYDWAGLVVWRVPGRKLFISPINDSYPREIFEKWWLMALTSGTWRDILDEYKIEVVLFPRMSPLVQALGRDPGWMRVAEDWEAVLLRRQPDVPEANFRIGIILLKQGRTAEAMPYFLKTLELNPNHAGAANNMGVALMKQGDISGALEFFRKATTLEPDYIEACYNLGIALAARQNFSEALTWFDRVLSINPDHKQARREYDYFRGMTDIDAVAPNGNALP